MRFSYLWKWLMIACFWLLQFFYFSVENSHIQFVYSLSLKEVENFWFFLCPCFSHFSFHFAFFRCFFFAFTNPTLFVERRNRTQKKMLWNEDNWRNAYTLGINYYVELVCIFIVNYCDGGEKKKREKSAFSSTLALDDFLCAVGGVIKFMYVKTCLESDENMKQSFSSLLILSSFSFLYFLRFKLNTRMRKCEEVEKSLFFLLFLNNFTNYTN